MAVRDEFVNDIRKGYDGRVDGASVRPDIEVWPEEDDFGQWVASHRDKVRMVICRTPEFSDSPFCGRGIH